MPESGSRNRVIAIVTGVVLIVIILTVILLNRDDDDSTETATVNTSSQTDSASATDSASTGAERSGSPTMTFKKGETCHTKNLAGGNSDALFEFEIDVPDGTEVRMTFTSTRQSRTNTADGIVKGNKVIVRVPVVAFGEEVTVASVTVGGEEIAPADIEGLPQPAHTVPEPPGSDCSLDAPETELNGTINQPNLQNTSNAAAN